MPDMEPPRLFQRFFRWYCRLPLQESILGDLEEAFYDNAEIKGLTQARITYAWTVLRFLRPGIVRKIEGTQKLNNYGMLKNYFKISIRNILRNKVFSMLNVGGLSLGIASCILILIYVKNELSFDSYHDKYDRIYRVLFYFGDKGEDVSGKKIPVSDHQVWGVAPMADALLDYFPEIEHVARFTSPTNWLVEYNGRRFQEKNFIFADSTINHVFSWNWLAGDLHKALSQPNTIALSKKIAEKYFGNENPVGKMLLMDSDEQFEVTGVYDIPPNSHFDMDAMISMVTFIGYRSWIFESWGYVDFYNYFTLHPEADIAQLEARIPEFRSKYYTGEHGNTYAFEPLANAYLKSDAQRQPGPIGNQNNIYLFISVAIFILVIACINFINLSTAKSVERAKEVAIRKSIGSRKGTIVFQFLIEAIFITFVSALAAGLMIYFGHGYLETLIGKELAVKWLLSPVPILIGCFLILLLGLVSGLYPAFVLSNFQPVKVLKGSFKHSTEGLFLRKSLVVLQFSLSIMLLVGTTVVYKQLHYLKSFDKGFNSDQMLVIDYGGDGKVGRNVHYIKSELLKHNAVNAASASRATPGEFFPNAGTSIETPTGDMLPKGPNIYEIDEDFIPTYQMSVIAGRNFSKDFPLDTTNALLVNESAAKMYGYSNPEDIVGKKFEQWGREGKVIGVVSDFNYVSLHKAVEPLSLRYSTWYSTQKISLKLNTQDYGKTIRELEDLWNKIVPYYPFKSYFNNTNFNKQYSADDRFGTIFTVFTSLAIFVACLGLFGLTVYSTNQRAKEIGVRKVLGASTQRIVAILSYDFVKLFFISLIISIPVSYFFMNSWLYNFSYQITLGWKVFAVAASITLIISMLTMSFKTISAALTNPAKVLKDE